MKANKDETTKQKLIKNIRITEKGRSILTLIEAMKTGTFYEDEYYIAKKVNSNKCLYTVFSKETGKTMEFV